MITPELICSQNNLLITLPSFTANKFFKGLKIMIVIREKKKKLS